MRTMIGYSMSMAPRAILTFTACWMAFGAVTASDRAAAGSSDTVDARAVSGYRRYNAGCNHCHGPDGVGSAFAPPLIEKLVDADAFRRVVLYGKASGVSVMKGFADDPNVAPYIDDIYAYLKARADGAIGRGRPAQ